MSKQNSNYFCGQTIHRLNEFGEYSEQVYFCRDFRNCETCAKSWMDRWAEYIDSFDGSLNVYMFDDNAANRRHINNATRTRLIFPQANGQIAVLSSENELLDEKPVSFYADTTLSDLRRNFTPVPRRQISGDLFGKRSHNNGIRAWENRKQMGLSYSDFTGSKGACNAGQSNFDYDDERLMLVTSYEVELPIVDSQTNVELMREISAKVANTIPLNLAKPETDLADFVGAVKSRLKLWKTQLKENKVSFITRASRMPINKALQKRFVGQDCDQEIMVRFILT